MDQPDDLPTPPTDVPPPVTYAPPMTPTTRTSPWVWVAVAMSAVALLVTVVLPVILIATLAIFVSDEFGVDFDGGPGGEFPGYYVDQESVIDAVEEPCEDMIEAAEDVSLGGPADLAATSLHQWAATAQRVVVAIDSAEPNADSREWRDDWKATIKAVSAYADKFGQPTNQLTLPDVESMYWETDADCGVPVVIAGLDPEWAGYMLGE